MKVLSIGNSFSQDAQRYLHELAKNDGVDLYSANLFIGGCSLETHYNNLLKEEANYQLEINGQTTSEFTSIKKALLSAEWDYITLQQASHKSGDYTSYTPYIKELCGYVKSVCPFAKILLHQTWAYEDKSEKLTITPYQTAEEMHSAIVNAYNQCLHDADFDGIIPCGEAMINATRLGVEKMHRDTFHASLGKGRYLLALTWYKYITGNDISCNNFNSLDESITEKERELIIKAVTTACKIS